MSRSENSHGPSVSVQIARSAGLGVIAQALTLGFGIAISSILAARLEKELFGIYMTLRNFAQFLMVIGGLGLSQAVVRFAPEVHRDRGPAGAGRFVLSILAVQAAAALGLTALLWSLGPYLGPLERFGISPFLGLAGLWAMAMLLKDTFNQAFMALHLMRRLVVLRLLYLCSLLAIYVLLSRIALDTALWLDVAVISVVLLLMFMTTRSGRGPGSSRMRGGGPGISRARVFRFAWPALSIAVLNFLAVRASEIYFIGYFYADKLEYSGFYVIGYEYPQLALSFIPMALSRIILGTIAREWNRDPERLGNMLRLYFRVLIITSVPIAFIGVVASEPLCRALFSNDFTLAGKVATAYSLIHLLPLIALPYSAGVQVVEKQHITVPLVLLVTGVNIALDLLLIPRSPLVGAVTAVLFTHVLTLPVRLYVMRKILGRLYFPLGYLGKTSLYLAPILLLYPAQLLILGPVSERYLLALGALFSVVLAVVWLLLVTRHLLQEEDIEWLGRVVPPRGRRLLSRLLRVDLP